MKKSHSKLSKNELVSTCEEGLCVGIGQEVGYLHEGGGYCQKYVKRGWNRKVGSGYKNFKNGWASWAS